MGKEERGEGDGGRKEEMRMKWGREEGRRKEGKGDEGRKEEIGL